MVVDIPVAMVWTVSKTVEAPRLQFIDVVDEILVVVQRQIAMQDQFRANSNDVQWITSGKDEFLSRENEWRTRLDAWKLETRFRRSGRHKFCDLIALNENV